MATVSATISSVAANLNARIVSVNEMKRRNDTRKGKQDEGSSSRGVGRFLIYLHHLLMLGICARFPKL